MEPLPIADINKDVGALMSADDEVNWLREGLFTKADSLGDLPGAINHTSRKLHVDLGIYEHIQNSSLRFTLKQATTFGHNPFSSSSVEAGTKLPECEPKLGSANKLGVKGGGLSDRFRNSFKPSNQTGVRRRVWKPNKRNRRMVFSSDVGLEETCRLAFCGLVGRLSYSYLADCPVSDWMAKNWVPILDYAPKFLFLTKGWMGFICKSLEDATILLKNLWVIGDNNLMLKRWKVDFDPQMEHFQLLHLWVLLSGLSLHLWNEGALRAIGDAPGHFITLDLTTMDNFVRKVGRILVEFDLHGGLPKAIDIEWQGHFFTQQLDYLGIPFWCSWFRGTGHLRRDYIGNMPEEKSEETLLQEDPPDYVFEDDFLGCDPIYYGPEPGSHTEEMTTLSGKLKNLCPTFFSPLSL